MRGSFLLNTTCRPPKLKTSSTCDVDDCGVTEIEGSSVNGQHVFNSRRRTVFILFLRFLHLYPSCICDIKHAPVLYTMRILVLRAGLHMSHSLIDSSSSRLKQSRMPRQIIFVMTGSPLSYHKPEQGPEDRRTVIPLLSVPVNDRMCAQGL